MTLIIDYIISKKTAAILMGEGTQETNADVRRLFIDVGQILLKLPMATLTMTFDAVRHFSGFEEDNTNDKFSYSAYVDLSLSPITLMILQTTRCFREKDLLEYLKRTAKQLKNRCC